MLSKFQIYCILSFTVLVLGVTGVSLWLLDSKFREISTISQVVKDNFPQLKKAYLQNIKSFEELKGNPYYHNSYSKDALLQNKYGLYFDPNSARFKPIKRISNPPVFGLSAVVPHQFASPMIYYDDMTGTGKLYDKILNTYMALHDVYSEWELATSKGTGNSKDPSKVNLVGNLAALVTPTGIDGFFVGMPTTVVPIVFLARTIAIGCAIDEGLSVNASTDLINLGSLLNSMNLGGLNIPLPDICKTSGIDDVVNDMNGEIDKIENAKDTAPTGSEIDTDDTAQEQWAQDAQAYCNSLGLSFPCTSCQGDMKLDDAAACQSWADGQTGINGNSSYCSNQGWAETSSQCINAKRASWLPTCPNCI